jgi:hypothetical protein
LLRKKVPRGARETQWRGELKVQSPGNRIRVFVATVAAALSV